MLLTFCNPPASFHFLILVIITHSVQSQFVFTIFFCHKRSDSVTDTDSMCFINEVHHLLSILVERYFCRPKSLILRNHVFYIIDIHTQCFAEIDF